jgi:hypothetical protein
VVLVQVTYRKIIGDFPPGKDEAMPSIPLQSRVKNKCNRSKEDPQTHYTVSGNVQIHPRKLLAIPQREKSECE